MLDKAAEHIVVGAGAAGLAVAYQLARRGKKVIILEARQPGAGAMGASGGMLSPAYEAEFEEISLLRAMVESRARYPTWVAALGDIGHEINGTYELALLPEDVSYLQRRFEFETAQGLHVQWLEGADLRKRLPMVSNRIPAGTYAPDEGQVDPVLLVARLVEACQRLGVEIVEDRPVTRVSLEADYVQLETSTGPLQASVAIACVGVPLEGLTLPFAVYPVRGQMTAVDLPRPGWLPAPIRYLSRQHGYGYAIPKRNRILLGGTAEEKGADPSLTVGGLLDILRRAYYVLPDLYESRIQDIWAGLRPATKARTPLLYGPVVGPKGARVYFVNGLYRNGILLLPLIGEEVARWVVEGTLHPLLQPFHESGHTAGGEPV